jgi:alcohol dehydrogenase (cytochrome c)
MLRRLFTVSLAIQLFAPALHGQTPAVGWEPITDERLREPRDGDWVNYRRTYDVAAYSPLASIDRSNVSQLRPVWTHDMRDNNRWVPTPIVANGLMYLAEGSGRVTAFRAATGEVEWVHTRDYPDDIATSQGYPRHRGVSIYENSIYWGTADSYLVALDARTGEQLWEVQTGDYQSGEAHNHPPLIAEGKVFLGFTGGDVTSRGRFTAWDAETGDSVWTIHTVPAPGEPGYETWAPNNVPPLGGATWHTASYDPELRLVYFSTGQPTPWASTLRGPGDALYTNSIMAVEVDTGRRVWHFQVVPEDNWDMDAVYESLLVDLFIGGRNRQALVHTSKIGWGVVLDRRTGEFLHAFRTGVDNLVTGWTPAGRPIYNPVLIPTLADVDSGKTYEVCPHIHGNRNLQSPSYSPVTGLYYLGINNACMTLSFVSAEFVPGRRYAGMTYVGKLAPGLDYVGEFVAFDPVSGGRAWTYRPENGAPMTASALATAGGIVFGGTAAGEFFALDSGSGERLWSTTLDGDISGAPVTFEIDGRQYVAVGTGGRIAQTTSLGLLMNLDVSPRTSRIQVFALPDS